jgi:hypothetical protein
LIPAWVRPTVRLVPWAALLLPLAAGTSLARLLGAADLDPPQLLALVVVAALAAAVALALDDPARELTATLPVGPRHRAAQRLALAGPIGLGAWTVASRSLLPGTALSEVVGLAASLSAVAVAAAVVAERSRPGAGSAVGAATPLAVVTVGVLLDARAGASPLELWAEHPWAIAATAVAVAAAAMRG